MIYFSKPEVSLGGRYFQFSLQYLKQIKQLSPDIIYESLFTTLTPRSYMTFIMSQLRNIPMVYVDSGDVPKKGSFQRLLNKLEKHVIVRANKIITYTESGKQRFLQEYKCPENKIVVIPKPIDIDKFDSREKLHCSIHEIFRSSDLVDFLT